MRPTGRVAWLFLMNTYYGHRDTLRLPAMVRLFANPAMRPLGYAMIDHLQQRRWPLGRTANQFGLEVGNPDGVSVAFDGDRAFFRSYDKAWKTRRLANNPCVEVAPAIFRGKPTGAVLRARARQLDGEEARLAAQSNWAAPYARTGGAVRPRRTRSTPRRRVRCAR